jgi:cell wall-associated NlpC family hydrolase
MKNLFILLILLINLTGCDVLRPAPRNSDNLSDKTSTSRPSSKNSDPSFIQDISTSETTPESINSAVNTPETPLFRSKSSKEKDVSSGNGNIDQLQFKYSILTNTPVEELTNHRLLEFMEQWYGVHYQYGGSTKDGIDCSAFASLLLAVVYDVRELPRISSDQYHSTRRVPKKDLREGDLVFFHTLGKGHRVTHVGVYLYNNRFVHASVSGVQINNLGEGYYQQHYVGAGRAID